MLALVSGLLFLYLLISFASIIGVFCVWIFECRVEHVVDRIAGVQFDYANSL